MDEQTLDLLLAADDIEACEYPPGFDYEQAILRVENLKPELDAIMGEPFELDRNVQDASYFTDLTIRDRRTVQRWGWFIYTLIGVCFSCFGNLFTIWSSPESKSVPHEKIEQIIKVVESHGFTYVDSESLDEPYSGHNGHFKQHETWRHRYFDYL